MSQNVKAWMTDPDDGVTVSIGKSAFGSFYAPTSEDHADVLEWDEITPGAWKNVYIKRDWNSGHYHPLVLSLLHFAFDSL